MTEIIGQSENGRGVYGESKSGQGVWGFSQSDTGVVGVNEGSGAGVLGKSANGRGVYGESASGQGVRGYSASGQGVWGYSQSDSGVVGQSTTGRAVFGDSGSGQGLWGHSQSDSGVVGVSETGVGVFGKGGRVAGYFEGDVEVTGDIRLTGADCAEEFNVAKAPSIEPGTVMVLGEDEALYPCRKAYDRRVVGVVSGAGEYRPGLVLGKQEGQPGRKPIALLGKAFCKADANYTPIEVGDLLTTSSTLGHAMKISDPAQAFGAVIGKALRPLSGGCGLIPILIALQ